MIDPGPPQICTRHGHCPICARPNGCRLETGEAFKGPCWCEFPILSGSSLRSLTSEMPEARCLCRDCLEALAADAELTWEELLLQRRVVPVPVPELRESDFYQEGEAMVFTAQYHLRRGFCCRSGCRHCPYGDLS